MACAASGPVNSVMSAPAAKKRSLPVTTTARTLEDCAADNLAPNLLLQAAEQALHRGLITRDEIPTVIATLRDFGGLP